MKRLLLSLLSTVAVFGAIAPMAHAMPTRLENIRQAHLNDTYLNPRQADLPNQGNSGTGNTWPRVNPQTSASSIRSGVAHRNDVYLNPRQISQANQPHRDGSQHLSSGAASSKSGVYHSPNAPQELR
jgi:hypothetical protein